MTTTFELSQGADRLRLQKLPNPAGPRGRAPAGNERSLPRPRSSARWRSCRCRRSARESGNCCTHHVRPRWRVRFPLDLGQVLAARQPDRIRLEPHLWLKPRPEELHLGHIDEIGLAARRRRIPLQSEGGHAGTVRSASSPAPGNRQGKRSRRSRSRRRPRPDGRGSASGPWGCRRIRPRPSASGRT